MRLLWSKRALAGLSEIQDYIAADSPERAKAVIERLAERAGTLLQFPHLGRRVPELRTSGFREFIEGNYRIVYRPAPGSIEIVTVFEGHRLLSADDLAP